MHEPSIGFFKSGTFKKKKKKPHFSLRSFARWLNLSPAQVSQILSGKRTVSLKSFLKISDKLDLSPIEKKEFLGSVSKIHNKNLKQYKDHEINYLKLQEDEFRLISDWYHLAILSLTEVKGAKADPRWIAQKLKISVQCAQDALLRLQRLKLITIKPQFKQIAPPLNVTAEKSSEAIRKFHKQCLDVACEKIDTVDLSLREFHSMTLKMNPLELIVRTFNEAGVVLFEKVGFRRVGLLKETAFIDSKFCDEFMYEMLIGNT